MTVPRAVRALVYARAAYRCEKCRRALTGTFGVSLHHRRSKGMGGSRRPDVDSPPNLVALCGSGTTGCHAEVHSQRLDVGEPGGFIVPQHTDPATVPVLIGGKWLLLTDDGTYGLPEGPST